MTSYEEQLSLVKLRQTLEERLDDYNMEPKLVSMQLVLFKVSSVRNEQDILMLHFLDGLPTEYLIEERTVQFRVSNCNRSST